MSVQKDFENNENINENSLRERAAKSQLRRKKELRAKLILLNSALALIIIMIAMVCKVVSLNRTANDAVTVTEQSDDSKKTDKKKEKTDKDSKAETTETPAPTATPEASGTDRWIRTDLDADKPMVALTFDDGPYAPVTKKILSVLKKNDAKATFFCVGNRLSSYKDVVKQAYQQGCQIASHTYEHKTLSNLKKSQILWQEKKTDKVLDSIIGCHTTALRPPGGFVNDKVKSTIQVPMVCWNVDSEDWKSRNTKKILKRCTSISDGDIVLMHDLYPTTAKAVETLVPKLRKKGFQLVTVDELFYYKGIKAKAGNVYYSGK